MLLALTKFLPEDMKSPDEKKDFPKEISEFEEGILEVYSQIHETVHMCIAESV